ncbi:hypothetical protein Pmar_PMAR007062 [Perkinsus marinus ATCC 50983]|uniref:Uncharacterized protein n=1 Tax=Perkinsus marinus (strain ATCC 50983 / TXsc) TaxID=423536 RepID=C5KZN7_PERM5|nr:hypothetical protein Pmar_PMAR007062 [Perkinsus marinus ATCC 50983]EER10065.1 hypothetical protein Pmar_PMAR007062 [Perkinsus marinus ATCC 50983]|eukprot:XP_002778270.1 hypothetical protein Pmar_PMAR007062 [Perkinsus marinus ATCC 50983]
MLASGLLNDTDMPVVVTIIVGSICGVLAGNVLTDKIMLGIRRYRLHAMERNSQKIGIDYEFKKIGLPMSRQSLDLFDSSSDGSSSGSESGTVSTS